MKAFIVRIVRKVVKPVAPITYTFSIVRTPDGFEYQLGRVEGAIPNELPEGHIIVA